MKTLTLFALFAIAIASSITFVFSSPNKAQSDTSKTFEKALFAGGCFWCMETPFEKLDGVVSVTSGYTNGNSANPTYKTYMADGHLEAVEVLYDPEVVSYQKLLDVFWQQIDATDDGGQFADRGYGYTTAIFYGNETQQKLAEASKAALDLRKVFDKPIVTPILPAATFYKAEEYHQDYYTKHPIRYKFYRSGSGRDRFLKNVWGDIKDQGPYSENELRERLTPIQYSVTQKDGTEPAFDNEYWDNKQAGIYVDIVSGEALFSSLDKYDSKTGWPSFSRPLAEDAIVEKKDTQFFMVRTEVRSKKANSHLGHLFSDGPQPTGLRYCINSASLRFVAVEDLEKEGYGKYKKLF